MQEAWKMNVIQEMNCDPVVRHTRRECLVFTGQMLRGVRIRGRRYCPEAGRRLSRCDGVRHPSLPRPTYSAYMPAGQLKTRFKKLLHRLYISSFHGRLLRQVGRRGCTSLPCQSVSFACISAGSLLREDSMRIGLFAAGYTWEALLNNPSE